MPVIFTIKITKQILERSKFCRHDTKSGKDIGKNCAVALAIQDLFQNAEVGKQSIYVFGTARERQIHSIDLPEIAVDFIKAFDSLSKTPELRKLLPEFEFDIEIPDEVIFSIDIEELIAIPGTPALATV